MTELTAEEFLPPYSRPRFAIMVFAITALVLLGFTLFPALDLAVSEFFYMPGPVAWDNSEWKCRGFALACHPVLSPIREFLRILPIVVAGICLLTALWICWQRRSISDRQALRYASAFWSMVISNLVLVDFLLKEHWGRPRPYHPYIGEARFDVYLFVPAGDWRGACVSNCSFVSGEANALFWMVCATVLLPATIRKPAFFIALALAVFGSLMRVAFGAHYLSDVVVGGLLAVLMFSLAAIIADHIDRRVGTRAALSAI